MAPLQRPSSWYESWMIGTPKTPATEARIQVATELLHDIRDKKYNLQTLQEILLIIDHECLCCELENPQAPDDNFKSTIGKSSIIDDFPHQLSSCLVEYITSSSHLKRELQCRALLSALELLHLQGVTAQQTDSRTKLQKQITRLFQDLVWLPGTSKTISADAFSRVECSHLLSLGAAYAQQFIRAESRSTAAVGLALDVMQLGVIAITTALGSGFGNLNDALRDLDNNFGRLAESPDNRYHDLFQMQRLVRSAQALQFYSGIRAQSTKSHVREDGLHKRALECSTGVAKVTLRQIFRILNSEHFKADVCSPSRIHQHFLALIDHGPSKLGPYHYFYGLLRCAAQLVSIIGPDSYPDGFEVRMRSIVSSSKEVSLRWKALEVLLSNPESRHVQTRMVLEETKQNGSREVREQLPVEIKCISELLRGDASSISILDPTPPRESMIPSDWMEAPTTTGELNPKANVLLVSLPYGLFYQKIRFSTAGLSTLASKAFFLNEDKIFIYCLSNQGGNLGETPIFRQVASKAKYFAAAISEEFVVVLLKKPKERSLEVFRYDGRMVGMDNFVTEADVHQWNPNSVIAIHETSDRAWIAVGGSVRLDGVLSGSIKIFCIAKNGENATLARHPVSFNRPKPNPLALDLVKTLQFSPDGATIVCATNNNRVLVWRLSNDARPEGSPCIIQKDLKRDMRSGEISSTSLFSTFLDHPYVFCTTIPSSERVINQGEWSFISPVGSAHVQINDSLIHDLSRLRKSGPILAGAVSPEGGVVALVEHLRGDEARLIIMPLVSQKSGWLSTLDPIVLDKGTVAVKGSEKVKISPTAVRFHSTTTGFCLVAVDIKGRVIKKHFEDGLKQESGNLPGGPSLNGIPQNASPS